MIMDGYITFKQLILLAIFSIVHLKKTTCCKLEFLSSV